MCKARQIKQMTYFDFWLRLNLNLNYWAVIDCMSPDYISTDDLMNKRHTNLTAYLALSFVVLSGT